MAEPALIPEFEPLLGAARPTVYQTNAFRVMGVAVDTPVVEIDRQVQKVEMMLKSGVRDQALRGLLPLPSGPSLAALQDAKRRLGDPQSRLMEEFFWFWPEEPGKSETDAALQALQRRDLLSTVNIWQGRSREPADTAAIHNLAILHHLQAIETEPPASSKGPIPDSLWIEAWRYWRTLVDQDQFWKRLATRIGELDDPRLTSQVAGQIRGSLLSSILQINLSLAFTAAEAEDFARADVHVRVMKQESGLSPDALRKRTQPYLEYIRTYVTHRCASAEVEASANVDQTAQILKRFLDDVRLKLEILNCLLGAGNELRDAAHDQVAQAVCDRMAAYGNETEDWKACEELLCASQPLAVSPPIRAKITDDLEKVRENLEFHTCWFCKKNQPSEKAAAIVEMRGDVTPTPIYQGTPYEGRTLPVKVPRCQQCRRIHMGRRIIVAAAAGIFAAVVAWHAPSPAIPAFCATIAAWLGTIAARHFGWLGRIRTHGGARLPVSPEMAKRHHPAVTEMKSRKGALGMTPADAPMPAWGAGIGKFAAWAGVFGILTCVFFALAGLRPSKSATVRKATPLVTTQPSTPATSDTTGLASIPITRQEGTEPNEASGITTTGTSQRAGKAYIVSLYKEVEANETQLQTLSASFEKCQQTLEQFNQRISEDRLRLDKMESDSRLGRSINKTEYEAIRARHNSNVLSHNTQLESCRVIAGQRDALVDATNAKIREYNNLTAGR
jgi:hypothetical protein